MIKLSNLFKKHEQSKDVPLPKGIKEDTRPPEEILAAEAVIKRSTDIRHHQSSIKLSPAMNVELEKERPTTPNIKNLYNDLLEKAKEIYKSGPGTKRNLAAEIHPLVEKMLESLSSGSDELLLIVLRNYPKPEDMLFYHVVNITIMSVVVGLGLGYERNRLFELCIAAFVHDIGSRNQDILNKPDSFSEEDFDKIKTHPNEGALTLSKIDPSLNQKILDAVKQEHERADGSGYPEGLVSDEINEYAEVIGLADVYEALMHNRPYRTKYTSIDTIRIILKNKKLFTSKVIKALIEAFGIFPIETLVQLNTKEIGVVVKRDQELISRPVVDIIIDSYRKEVKQPKRINLASNPVIYIDNCVKQEDKYIKTPIK